MERSSPMIVDGETAYGKRLVGLLYAEGPEANRVGTGSSWREPKFTMRPLVSGEMRFWEVERIAVVQVPLDQPIARVIGQAMERGIGGRYERF